MNELNSYITYNIIATLGWTLIHFLWQGTFIAICLKLATLLSHNAQVRYILSVSAFCLMLITPILTYFYLDQPSRHSDLLSLSVEWTQLPAHQPTQTLTPTTSQPVSLPVTNTSNQKTPPPISQTPLPAPLPQSFTNTINSNIPYIVQVWSFGILLLSLRLLYIWFHTQHLKHTHTYSVGPKWEQFLDNLCKQLEIRPSVTLLKSTLAQSPMVIGWFKPVILIPTSTFLGLTPHQIETILIHELAHIRRYDYLINMLQSFLEILLFYHPATWWVSRQMRIEREHCCDDLTVTISGNATTYARALFQLETNRHTSAVAANGGFLHQRILRILSHQPKVSSTSVYTAFGVWGMLILGICLLALTVTSPHSQVEEIPTNTPDSLHKITTENNAIAHVKKRYMAFDFEAGFLEGRTLAQKFPDSSQLKAWSLWNQARLVPPNQAIQEAEDMVKQNPTDPWAWFALTGALGYAEHNEDFRTRAYQAHLKFLELNPTYPDAIWLTATAIHRQFEHKKDDIIPYVDSHLNVASDPSYLLTLKGFILGWMAKRKDISIVESRRRFAAALNAFEQARQTNPQNVWAYVLPSYIYAEKNRYDEAYTLIKTALEQSPQSPIICQAYLGALKNIAMPDDQRRESAQLAIDTMIKGRETYPHTLSVAYQGYERYNFTQKAAQLEDNILKLLPDEHYVTQAIRKKRSNSTYRSIYPDPVFLVNSIVKYMEREQQIDENMYHRFSNLLTNARYQPQMSREQLLSIAQKTMTLTIPHAHNYQWQALLALIDRLNYEMKQSETPLPDQTFYFSQIRLLANQLRNQAPTQTDENIAKHILALGYDVSGWLYLAENRLADAKVALQKAHDLETNGIILFHLGKYYEKENQTDLAEKYYKQGLFTSEGAKDNELALWSIYEQKNQTHDGFYAYIELLAQEQLKTMPTSNE